MKTDSQWSEQKICLARRATWRSLLSITIPVSLLANELYDRSVLHGQVSLAAVNQVYLFHQAMNGCKNLKMHKRFALKMSIFTNEQSLTYNQNNCSAFFLT